MRFITLTEEEKSKVATLYKTSPNSVVRTRCLSLLYSNEQRSIKEVSTLVGLSRRSLERLFNVWESSKDKYATLSIKTGRGANLKLLPIKDLLPDLIKEHSRNLNPILEELYQKHHIRVCKLTLQNFLKDYGLYRWKRARSSLKRLRNKDEFKTKQEQLSELLKLHRQGYLDLYFADESHFGLTPNIPYAWQHKNEPILLPASKSKRLSVFGLMNTDCKFYGFINQGSIKTKLLIDYMDQFVAKTTKKTIVVLDNAPTHRSKLFIAKIKEWEKLDVHIFFLPAYSPELNKIEILWRFIKYKWLNFDAFLNFKNLNKRLNDLVLNIGTKYVINFY